MLFDGTRLVLLDEFSDPFNVALPIFFDHRGYNDRPIQFSFKGEDQVLGWQLTDDSGAVLDAGPLTKERHVRRGDRIAFVRGSIKSAIIGDILGITAVFMPSGFVVGVPPAAAVPGGFLGGTLGDFAYPDQEVVQGKPWWLPKRRWDSPPDGFAPSWELLAQLSGWQKRLTIPETYCRERVLRRQQELVVAGVI